MLSAVEYIENHGEAVLYRCYGDSAYLQLPDEVDGLPVTQLADHCFAPEPSFRLRNRLRKMAFAQPDGRFGSRRVSEGETVSNGSSSVRGREEAARVSDKDPMAQQSLPQIAGTQIEEVYLPSGVRSIGNYTFCGCRNLKRLYVPASFSNEGGGSFVDVHQLREIIFTLASDDNPFPRGLKAMIIDIPDETEAVIRSAKGEELYRLVFPGYYEESKENTPARIIQVVYQGMGFKYRQCLKDGIVDMRRYDGLFYETKVQEFPDTVMKLVFDRMALALPDEADTPDILSPLRPSREAQEQYLDYLREQAQSVCAVIVKERQTENLMLLCRLSYFDGQRLSMFLEEAGNAGWAQAVSLLMEYRRTHFSQTKRHKYEL